MATRQGTLIDAPEIVPAESTEQSAPLAPVTPLALMRIALERGQVEQLQILQDMHFREMSRVAELRFNEAMNKVQEEIECVAPDLKNPQTSSKYASYAALNKAIRPVYTKYGFSLSFSEEDSPKPDHVRIIGYVAREGHTRIYRKDMPVDTTGPKGNAVMTKTHATGAADSYAKRYLLKDIFNIAIGEEDKDGNAMEGMQEHLDWIANCKTFEELDRIAYNAMNAARRADALESVKAFNVAAAEKAIPMCRNANELQSRWAGYFSEARKLGDNAGMKVIQDLSNKRKKELGI